MEIKLDDGTYCQSIGLDDKTTVYDMCEYRDDIGKALEIRVTNPSEKEITLVINTKFINRLVVEKSVTSLKLINIGTMTTINELISNRPITIIGAVHIRYARLSNEAHALLSSYEGGSKITIDEVHEFEL